MSTPLSMASLLVLAGAAAWLLCGRDGAPPGARLVTGLADSGVAGCATTPGRWHPGGGGLRRRWRGWYAAAAKRVGPEIACVPVGAAVALPLRSPVPLVAGMVAVPLLRRWLRRRARARAAALRRSGVIDLCTGLAAELRAGRPPGLALVEAVGERPWLEDEEMRDAAGGVIAAARFGGDVPAALRQAAGVPGAGGLAGVAACWQVAMDSGAGLAGGLDRVVLALRAEEDQREEVGAQLAGPRTTAVLLAALPAFGVVLGTALGAEPLRVLLHTPVGLGCLLLGVALECVGLFWTARIVRGAS